MKRFLTVVMAVGLWLLLATPVMAGGPVVGVEVYPPDKLAILAPWLGLALALAIGGSLILARRRHRAD